MEVFGAGLLRKAWGPHFMLGRGPGDVLISELVHTVVQYSGFKVETVYYR